MKVTAVVKTYTSSEVLAPDNYGGWMCVNIGSAQATVMGYPLAPGEGLDFLQVGNTTWLSTITMDIPAGAAIRITRLRFTEDKKVGIKGIADRLRR